MLATLTSKGQLTLPKEIRDRLGLDAGATLDFHLLPDNTITARAVKPDARSIRGLLKSPHAKALTVAQMDDGVTRLLRDKHAPATPRAPSKTAATRRRS
jgi:antitoxin PrlF